MNTRLWQTAVDRAGRLAAPLALDELPDADLLGRFLAARDEPAFAAIVRRHGPLVWGVCRNLSSNEADAEDAFQATFLALFRAAGKVRTPNALGAWLHRVAGRVCKNGLRAKGRRARRERAVAVAEATRPVAEAAWDRWQEAVHAEIDRLPDTLRVPFVLCVLQGVRQGEAAKRLGWKIGTVSGRVCLAKQALADAIGRRGLTGPAVLAAMAGGMFAGPLSAGLVARGTVVVRSATGSEVSTTVHELARGATGGIMSKTKLLAAALLAGALTIGAVGTRQPGTADAQTPGGGGGVGAAPPAGEGPKGSGKSKAGPAAGGPGGMPGSSGGGGGLGGFGSLPAPKVEYKFVAVPDTAEKYKSTLTQHGNDGWEYAGQVPHSLELIFKKTQRSVVGGGVMSGGGFGPPSGGGGFGGFPGVGGGGGFPGGGGFGGGGFFSGSAGGGPGASPAPKGGGAPGGLPPAGPPPGGVGPGGSPPGAVPPGGGEVGVPPPVPMGGGAGKASDQVELRLGETIRHRMNSNVIDRVLVKDPKVADVTLDPTDAKRVLIKALTPGGTQLELTDALGNKEKYTIRVR